MSARKAGRPKATAGGLPWDTKSEEWLRDWWQRHRDASRISARKQRGVPLDLPIQPSKPVIDYTTDELREKYKKKLQSAYARKKK
jgi:hypothetical protein